MIEEYASNPEPTQETLLLAKNVPVLPDAVLKRFPDMQNYNDEWDKWWNKTRRLLIEAHQDLAAPINQTTEEVEAIKVESGGFMAAIDVERIARIDADGALASLITTVSAAYIAADAIISASVVTEATARVTADSALATSITTVIANYTSADAAIAASVVTEATARSSADSAEATTRSTADATLTTNLATTNANVSTEVTARSTADAALASSITSVIASYTAADSTISASVTTEATARASADGAIHARWGVNIDINNRIVGRIHLDGTSASSTFLVAVDKFVVENANGTITALDIRPGGKIVMGADVQSDNFSSGSAGWQIQRNSGSVEFNDGIFRGTLAAGGATAVLTGTGLWAGYDGGIYKFRVGNPAGNYLFWDGTNLSTVGLTGVGGSMVLLGTISNPGSATTSTTDVTALTLPLTVDGALRQVTLNGTAKNPSPNPGDVIVNIYADAVLISTQTYSGLIGGTSTSCSVTVTHTPAAGPVTYTVKFHASVGTMTAAVEALTLLVY